MTELNKKWYEGTLEKDKYYYAKDSSEGDCIVHIDKSNELTFTGWEVPYKPDQSNVLEPFKLRTELLERVPSYEEWQVKLEENAQLKELLEWCRDELFEIYSNEVSHPEDVPIIKKLNEVLK